LNSAWQPRLYIIGGDGTMIFVENSADSLDKIMRDAKAALAKALSAGQ